MPNAKPLSLELLRLDGGTQNRVGMNEETVADYAELIKAASPEWPFGPLDVFHDGTEYFVADGFHRCLGAASAKRGSVPCNVHKGSAVDALIFGMTANDKHGLRRTREDKRYCVELLLDSGVKMPQKEIAQKAGVSARLVQMIVADRNPRSIAGKMPTPQNNKHVAPPTPSSGGSDTFGDFDPSDWPEPDKEPAVPIGPPTPGKKGKPADLGKCPNCAGERWKEDEDGWECAKCHHPHGEPAGDVDGDRVKIQRQKTVKTVEALMRAFDDLQLLVPKEVHEATITCCKGLLATAKGWK